MVWVVAAWDQEAWVVEAWDLAVREPVEEAANRKSSECKKRLAFCQPFFT
jgi:hypothetical protein